MTMQVVITVTLLTILIWTIGVAISVFGFWPAITVGGLGVGIGVAGGLRTTRKLSQ